MSESRFEALQQFVEANPSDSFSRYGLAHEYVNRGEFDKALEQFHKILEVNPDYQAAYYHAGQTYEKTGDKEQARAMYQKGIEVAVRSGDLHAKGELEEALENL